MANSARYRRIALILVAAGAIGGLILGTLPNWNSFLNYLPTFATLWAVPENRRVLSALVLKFFAPIWAGALIAALCWLGAVLRPLFEEDEKTPTNKGLPVALPQAQTPLVSSTPADRGHPSVQALPVTPLPAMPENVAEFLRTYWTQSPEPGQSGAPSAGDTHFTAIPLASPVEDSSFEEEDIEVLDLELEDEDNGEEEAEKEAPATPQEHPYWIEITLLKDLTITVHVDQGGKQVSKPVLIPINAKRVQLLAYLAWRRQRQYRENILEEVFAHGLSDEDASPAKLTQAFNDHRKLLKSDVRRVIKAINKEAGSTLIPEDLDIFETQQKLWGMAQLTVRVIDLERINDEHTIIEKALSEGQLVSSIPDEIRDACDRLIVAYPGDFLEHMIEKYEIEFDPWTSSWVREPFTIYRDFYLQALWYAAEYRLQKGQQLITDRLNDNTPEGAALRRQQQELYGKAAQIFYHYAKYATNHKFDKKLIFSRQSGRGPGERVLMSERALRRCLMLYGLTGATHLVDQAYSSYYRHMKRISSDYWTPSPATLHDLDAAKVRTNEYRLPSSHIMGHMPFPDSSENDG